MAQSLIKSIRSNGGEQDVALAGYSQSQVTVLVNEAFGTPIPSNEPISLRFVVGGGKKVRSKYSDSLPKEMTAALQANGYTEDKSASLSLSCQGLFKYHHDLGEDLKRIVVFPKLVAIEEKDDGGDDEDDEDGLLFKVAGIRVNGADPARVAAAADQAEFVTLVVRFCPSFFQRRALLRALKEYQVELLEVEKKMSRMEQLEDKESKMYEETVELHEKIERLTQQMEGMLGRGYLTAGERTALLKELLAQQDKMEIKLVELGKDEKKKKAKAKVEGMLQQMKDRIEGLRTAPPYRRPPLLLAEPMAKLEKIARNSLTVPPEVERRLKQMHFESAGWFADSCPAEPRQAAAARSRAKPASSSSGGGGAGGFTTVKSKKGAAKKGGSRRAAAGAGNAFYGLAVDSD